MTIEFNSTEEARAILHCLNTTMARNSYGSIKNVLDHCENFEHKLRILIKENE